MNIVVCVKQVPDTWAEKKLDPADQTLDRESADAVLNEIDEYAVEQALQLQEAHGGEVTVLSMGPEKALETIRKALAMGADKGVHITDAALHGSDAVVTARVLSAALGRLDWDLVIFGSESTDARMSVVPAMVSELTGAAQLTMVNKVEWAEGTLRVERPTEAGFDRLEAATPAVVSVLEKTNEPRYPSFKGIMAAKKKPVETLGLSDLGLDPAAAGLAGSATAVTDVTVRPPRQAGTKISDEGEGGRQLADYLASQKFI